MKEDKTLYFVTTNKSKYNEAKEIFSKYGLKLEWFYLDIEEIQSDSLFKIVMWKGYEASKIVEDNFIIEDTGLFINALNGFPGPYSSYVFKMIGNEGILKLMKGVMERTAYFQSYGLLYLGNNVFKIFNVRVEGRIAEEMRGTQGFGFDPIFIPKNHGKTYAEMTLNEKNEVSHRGKLFNKIALYIVEKGVEKLYY